MLIGLLVGFAATKARAVPTPTAKPKSHGNALSGTVMRIDDAARTFLIRNAAGKETTLIRTNATRVQGGTLKAGDRVAVRWLERDGKKVATSVRIESPTVAAATPTATVPARSP
jgi:hypothetical protein